MIIYFFISGVNDQPGGSDTLSAVKRLNEEVAVKKKEQEGKDTVHHPFLEQLAI